MIHSLLIVGGTREKRKTAAGEEKRANSPELSSEREELNSFPSRAGEPALPAGRSPARFDTMIIEPQENKQTITIEQIRTLQHQLSLKPYSANKKTVVVLEAQRMTVEAQNALLKTLEEPPAHSLLLLTAPSTKNLLPTIVSRCRIVRLRPKIDLDTESEEYKKAVEEFLELLQMGRGERLAWTEDNKKILNSQLSTLNLPDVWVSVLRDLLLVNSGCQALALNSFKPFRPFKPQILTEALENTIKTKRLLSTTNVSPRLAIEILLLDLPMFADS